MLPDKLIDSLTTCEKCGTWSLFNPCQNCGHDKWKELRRGPGAPQYEGKELPDKMKQASEEKSNTK